MIKAMHIDMAKRKEKTMASNNKTTFSNGTTPAQNKTRARKGTGGIVKITSYDMVLDAEGLPSLSVSNVSEYDGDGKLDTPAKTASMLRQCFRAHELAEEHVWLLCLNAKGNLTAVSDVSHGGYSESLVDPRPIFTRALLLGASHIILAHNHPSGDPTPSRCDIDASRTVDEAGKMLGCRLIDFLIVCRDRYCSFSEQGMISRA